jgi:hypothetical protein
LNRLPSAQDSARLIKPTYPETLGALEEHYRRPLIGWSYNKVRALSRALFSGELSATAVESMFIAPPKEDSRSPKSIGRKANKEVAHLVRQHAVGRSFQCYDLKARKVALSVEHALTVNPGFYFVEYGVVKIFWLQPRRTYALTLAQMGLLNGLLQLSHFRDDFEEAELELLDLSAIEGVRTPQAFGRADLPKLTDDELRMGLEHLLRAYLVLKDRDDLRPERPAKEPEGPSPGLFDV